MTGTHDSANDNEAPRQGGPERVGKDGQRSTLPRRFYTTAAVETRDAGFAVTLDERDVKTPAKAALVVPSRALAEAIAAEWRAQNERIAPASMPMTLLANTALDAVAQASAAVAADIVAFAGNDALCYRAENPPELVERQSAAWDPLLAWAENALKAKLMTTRGVVHVAQPEVALKAIAQALAPLDFWQLAPLHVMTALTGSALLALAVGLDRLTWDQAWSAAHVDEDWQLETWGEDTEACDRRNRRRGDMASAARFLKLVREI